MIAKYGKLILLGVIVILVLLALQRGCRLNTLRDEYNQLKGQYDTLKKASDAAMTQALEYIKKQNTQIAEQNALIALKDDEINQKYGQIDSLNSHLATLEEGYATLTDQGAMIVNLKSQVNIYKDKCLTFEGIIKDKDVIISSWIVKYVSEINISETWETLYEKEHALRLVAGEALKVQEKRLKSINFGSNIKTIAILAVGGYLTYDLLIRRK